MKSILLFLILSLQTCLLVAQGQTSSAYLESEQSFRAFDEENWKAAKADIDYSDELERQPPKEQEAEESEGGDISWDTSQFGKGAFIILIGLTLLAIGLFIYYRVKNANPRNQRLIRGGKVASLETIEEDLDKHDPTSAIDRAIQMRDFRLALRLYYLKALRELSLAEYIQWKRDKTNGEYIRELSGHPLRSDFRQLTLLFERIWYGNQELDALNFKHIQPQFDQFLGQIQPHEKQ
ncbi:MAG: DUF4129 domain-containing protein [Bacteroidota bacterium]